MVSSSALFRVVSYECLLLFFFFFFNDTATTEIYTLSLHDALPISCGPWDRHSSFSPTTCGRRSASRSEEHTSELQSLAYLVCRLLLEKKKNTGQAHPLPTMDHPYPPPPRVSYTVSRACDPLLPRAA